MRVLHMVRFLGRTVLFFGVAFHASIAQTPKGSLFIIGGGERPASMMRQFVDLAGGPERARIVIIPNASGDANEACADMVQEFHALGVQSVECCLLTREQASDPHAGDQLTGATGIYFTGGDQSRVTKALLGTPFHRTLKDLYLRGSAIGGTSAGAALMSKVMITGDERINKDTARSFKFIKRDNIVTVEGMGFLSNAIIDQHFVARRRHNRLISVVLEHPELVGVGVDEATAIIVQPGGLVDVIGEGSVVIYDATRAAAIRTDSSGNLAASGLTVHLLTAGDSYDLNTRTVRPGGGPQ